MLKSKAKVYFLSGVVMIVLSLIILNSALYYLDMSKKDPAQLENEQNNYLLAEMLAEKDPKLKNMFDSFVTDDGIIDNDELAILKGHWLKITREVN